METYDIVIIGGGPAGLTAGIYASRAKMKTLLIESTFSPSLITTTDLIENYPGFPGGIDGFGLVERFKEQAVSFGLEAVQDDITAIKASEDGSWWCALGSQEYPARALIIASGAAYAKLGVPGEKEFTGRGVSYCATCDAPFYRDRALVVVGGGDTAVQ
ncbi:MAG TPA: FAD-dependent oxidoreductase, partial [Deltaproteobacteria bacterium]|nr:FAD-dependent oxidoreductase [Deltaproteobacteria bacterium]